MDGVAIVEDQKAIAQSIGRAIEHDKDLLLSGIFKSAEQALNEMPLSRTKLVLMDIGLPKMDGIECMLRLKDMKPNLMFLMFTVFDTEDKLFDALRFGANGYILKSDGIMGALKAIRELLAGGAPMSREIAKKVINSMRTPTASEDHDIPQLTCRQNQILKLIADGLYNKEIASRLQITEGTVKQHIHNIYTVLEVSNRVEARNKYFRA